MSRPEEQGSGDAADTVAAGYIEAPASRPMSAFSRHLWAVLWPAFLVAGVTEMLVFALVDPHDLRWFGGAPIEASRPAVYTSAFFVFWLLISLAGALTQLLLRESDELNPATRSFSSSRR